MVSLWPWKKDDSSPASFEKTLSTLSAKITSTQSLLEHNRATARRVKVLSTLWLSLGYMIYAILVFLVVGWQNMGPWEWSIMAGGPVLIYLVRTISTTFFDLRIESLSSRLKDQQAERAKTIQKLKDATKYDTTLELLEKYGGGEGKPKSRKKGTDDDDAGKKSPGRPKRQPSGSTSSRTNIPPPATANIQRPGMPPSNQGTPQQSHSLPQQRRALSPELTAEFSPNAFDGSRPRQGPMPPQTAPSHAHGHHESAGLQSHWYDRVMDLLLGEDETASKNRFVLICRRCRLVNGQAPPGTSSLAELGMWKCMACGEQNGEVDEGKRIVKEVLGAQMRDDTDGATENEHDGGESSDLVEVEAMTDEDDVITPSAKEDEAEGTPGARRRKGKGKK